MKEKLKERKGITLIALVITIIVLLILAGVSISMLTGDNGILTQAKNAKEETRGGTVQEARDLWFAEKKMNKELNKTTEKTLEDLINELVNDKYLTEDEKDIILGNASKGIEAQYQINIGNRVINFKENDEINWENFEPGLYETGTNKMIKSWEQLLEDGEIIVGETQLIDISGELQGDLIISNSIETLKYFGSFCGEASDLTGIRISEKVVEIPNECFRSFKHLIKVDIPSSVTSIGSSAFGNCIALTEINIPEGVTSIREGTFKDCLSLTEINIPSSVTSIGSLAFESCRALTKINIPEGVTSIGEYAFCGCSNFTEINIPPSVTSIGESAFSYCSSLTKINIPSSVTSIEGSTFYECSSLTEINIPLNITSIGYQAFYNCSELQTVYYEGTEEEWKKIKIDSKNSDLKNANIIYNKK